MQQYQAQQQKATEARNKLMQQKEMAVRQAAEAKAEAPIVDPNAAITQAESKQEPADVPMTSSNPDHLQPPAELQKQPSRTSGRARPNVNYTTMAAGTGEINASMDYNDVGGNVSSTAAVK